MSNRLHAINTLLLIFTLFSGPALAQHPDLSHQNMPAGPPFQCARFFEPRGSQRTYSLDWNRQWLEAIELAQIAIQMHPQDFPGPVVAGRTRSVVNVESVLNRARASRGIPLRTGITHLRRLGAWSGHQNWRSTQDIPIEIQASSSRAFVALLLASAWAPEIVYRLAVLNMAPGFQHNLPKEALRELHSSLADLDPKYPGFATYCSEQVLRAYARFNSETATTEAIRGVLELPLPLRLRYLVESIATPARPRF